MLSHFSHVRHCDPMVYGLPGSSDHKISQARILEWVAMPFSRGSSRSRDQTYVYYVSYTGMRVLYHWCLTLLKMTNSSLVSWSQRGAEIQRVELEIWRC